MRLFSLGLFICVVFLSSTMEAASGGIVLHVFRLLASHCCLMLLSPVTAGHKDVQLLSTSSPLAGMLRMIFHVYEKATVTSC